MIRASGSGRATVRKQHKGCPMALALRRRACAKEWYLLSAMLSLAACSDGRDELATVQQRSQCGVLDWQEVEAYDGTLGPSVAFVASHQRPVGTLRWRTDLDDRYDDSYGKAGTRYCTATLISLNRMITAGHCFNGSLPGAQWPTDPATSAPLTPEQGVQESVVEFLYQYDASGSLRTPVVVDIAELEEYYLGDQDYAVLRLASNAGSTFGFNVASPFLLATNDPITVIQHPTSSPAKKIHAGWISLLGADGLVYYLNADTAVGSSGSGVLSEKTGFIAAVHNGGDCSELGNYGVPVSSIYAHSPLIRQLGFDVPKMLALGIL